MFVHLRCQSHFSFLQGAMSPEELARAAAARGMSAVALTDVSILAGAVDFQKECDKLKIKPIFGASVWIEGGRRSAPKPLTLFDVGEEKEHEPGFSILLLCEDATGWKNLCSLLTLASRTICWAPHVRLQDLRAHREGLLMLVGGRYGLTARESDTDVPHLLQGLLGAIGPGRTWLEVSDLGVPGDEERNAAAVALAQQFGLPIVATNEVRYVDPEGCVLLDAFSSVAQGRFLGEDPSVLPTDQAWLKPEAEMEKLFPRVWLDEALVLAERCRFKIFMGKPYLPEMEPDANLDETTRWKSLFSSMPPPHAFQMTEPPERPTRPEGWKDVDLWFAWYARHGLEVRLAEDPRHLQTISQQTYLERLEREIAIIISMGFSTYLLIVAEFINWAKDHGVPVGPGRGSAAGSLAVWAMRITDVNPLPYGLMFERFLNPERVSMPDIDTDFGQVRREDVIAHVRERYGEDNVGQIMTIGEFKAKAAITDAARALGVMFEDAKRWTSLIEGYEKLEDAEKKDPKVQALLSYDMVFRRVFHLAKIMEGRPRQRGVHAAGVIIASRRLADFAPLFYDADSGRSVLGMDMSPAEKVGLVKFDFLGLKTLDILQEALDHVEATTKTRPDLSKIDWEDPEIYKLLSRADGLGLFQVESHGMRALLERMVPSRLEDLIAAEALYRPGPMGSGMVDDFVERKHGRVPVEWLHPSLSEVLGPTYGVIVYQEQVMQCAQVLAGYTLGGADLLRRAMGKKKQEEMDKERVKFVAGAEARGIDKKKAVDIFNLIDHFAGYGFNKSHSTCYSVITIQTAWLKTYHRACLMASVLSWNAGNHDELAMLIYDCVQAGLRVFRPSLQKSGDRFTIEEDEQGTLLRYGLGAIKGIGSSATRSILEERQRRGPFSSLEDFLRRRDPSKVHKTVLEVLVQSGALDDFGMSRHAIILRLQAFDKKRPKTSALQETLFSKPTDASGTMGEDRPRDLQEQQEATRKDDLTKPWSPQEALARQKKVLGYWVDRHPLDRYVDVETLWRTKDILGISRSKPGDPVLLPCVVHHVQTKVDKKGRRMAFLTVADRTGIIEVALYGKKWELHRNILKPDHCVLLQGFIEPGTHGARMSVDRMLLLEDLRSINATTLEVQIGLDKLCEPIIDQVERALAQHRGACPVRVVTSSGGVSWKIRLSQHWNVQPCSALYEKLEQILGVLCAVHLPGHGPRPS